MYTGWLVPSQRCPVACEQDDALSLRLGEAAEVGTAQEQERRPRGLQPSRLERLSWRPARPTLPKNYRTLYPTAT